MTILRAPTVSEFPGCLPLSFFFYSRGTRLGSKIGLKFCSPSRGGFIGLLSSIIKSRARSDLQSEDLITNSVRRWNVIVMRWNLLAAKNAARESFRVSQESSFLQNNGPLEISRCGAGMLLGCAGIFLPQKMQRRNPSVSRGNPDSRRIMGRWNFPGAALECCCDALESFCRKKCSAGILPCLTGILIPAK